MKNHALIDILKWLCGIWLGAMLFFTAAATPSLFSAFDKAEAGRIVAALFPGYYLANHLAFLLAALAASVAIGTVKSTTGLRSALVLLAIAWTIGPALNQFWLAPHLRELKAAGELSSFGKWHGLSMLLNLAAITLVATAPWRVRVIPEATPAPTPE